MRATRALVGRQIRGVSRRFRTRMFKSVDAIEALQSSLFETLRVRRLDPALAFAETSLRSNFHPSRNPIHTRVVFSHLLILRASTRSTRHTPSSHGIRTWDSGGIPVCSPFAIHHDLSPSRQKVHSGRVIHLHDRVCDLDPNR